MRQIDADECDCCTLYRGGSCTLVTDSPIMDDLIRRQDVLDEIKAWQCMDAYYHPYGKHNSIPVDEIVTRVLGIQNETAPQDKGKWIPCSLRLPRDGTWNIFTDGKNRSVERYKADAIDHFFPDGRWFEFEDAIAWMPLPEKYEEEENGTDR